ncbi:MAG: hypothetical protein JSV88_12395 [Candidatus Aminicenantes bacterium]|nr:MAG: hypothetical protein JSV88_12395 [Candidatus Aminicenantes bacterium]
MVKKIDITIENKLAAGERDLNVFHYSTRSAHIISHNSSVTLPLRDAGENDYLDISVVRGPGYLWMTCVISLPWWIDFDFSSEGKLAVTHSGDRKRILLKIPPGPPTWELNITRPTGLSSIGTLTAVQAENITISDNGTGEGG